MKNKKIIRVFLAVSDDLDEVKNVVYALMDQLNSHFKPRDLMFVPSLPSEGPSDCDLTLLIYWKEFGQFSKNEFEKIYKQSKSTNKPKIFVLFKNPPDNISDNMKSFRNSFLKDYKLQSFHKAFLNNTL